MKLKIFIPIFLLFTLSACSFSLAADVTPPPNYTPAPPPSQPAQPVAMAGPLYPLVPPNPANGQPIFEEKCVPCHGASGLGDGPRAAQLPNPPAAIGTTDIARKASPALWYQTVTQGKLDKFMPPFASLADHERWDVIAYVYSLSTPPDTVQKGASLFKENCARCHGNQGKGDGPDGARLSKRPRDLTDQAFIAEKSAADFYQTVSQGVQPDMPAFKDKLSDADRWTIGEYLRSLAFNVSGASIASANGTSPAGTLLPGASNPVTSTSTRPGTPAPGSSITTTTSLTITMATITGTISNASGAATPAGMTVTLHGFDQMSDVLTRTTTAQDNGFFKFDQVPNLPGRFYVATTEYRGTTYGSEITSIQAGASTLSLPVQIYETTTDAASLSIDRLHLFFEIIAPQKLQIGELFIISNNGTKTVISPGTGQPVITFKLPSGYSNLKLQDGNLGDRFIELPGGFGDTFEVRPGSGNYQVMFTYEMPFNNKVDLSIPVSLPAGAVVALVPDGTVQIKSDQLQDTGTRDVQGSQYRMYSGSNLAAGDAVKLNVTDAKNPSSFLGVGSHNELLVGAGALGVVLIIAGLWLFQRSRSTVAIDPLLAAQPPTTRTIDNPETLMDAILALDDLYKAGQLPEQAYRQRRTDLKDKLKAWMDKE